MRAFVTGGAGFVGRWLIEHLQAEGDEVVSVDVGDVDVTDGEAVRAAVSATSPDAVYHLAARTHVGESWDAPAETFRVNALGTLAVLEAVRAAADDSGRLARVLLVSSAEVYGPVEPDALPLTEESPLRPATPYAASKVAAEYIGVQAWLGHGVPVVRARAFNHVGPGQSPRFVVSSLARQVAEAEREGARLVQVGNLAARRDFTDVRDVVRAYRLLVEHGEPGQVYQVCSGRDTSIDELARRLVSASDAELELKVDPDRFRPVDVPVLVGSAARLQQATGWAPTMSTERTLADVLAWWRAELA